MIGQQSGDHRPNDVQNPASVYRRFFDKMSSTDRLAIVGRLTPDDRVTIDGYHDVNFLTKSADCRSIIGRPSSDASSMRKTLKIGGSVNETFNLYASTKKSPVDQKISQYRCRHRPTSADNRPISPNFPNFCSPAVGQPSVLGNVTAI